MSLWLKYWWIQNFCLQFFCLVQSPILLGLNNEWIPNHIHETFYRQRVRKKRKSSKQTMNSKLERQACIVFCFFNQRYRGWQSRSGSYNFGTCTPLILFLHTPYNKRRTKWLLWNCQKSYKEVSHAYQLLVICLCYYQGFLSQSW